MYQAAETWDTYLLSPEQEFLGMPAKTCLFRLIVDLRSLLLLALQRLSGKITIVVHVFQYI